MPGDIVAAAAMAETEQFSKCNVSPPELNKFSCYSDYRDRVEAWQLTTDLKPTKLGLILALSLPDESKLFGNKLATSLFRKHPANTLNTANGIGKVIEWLDEKLGQNKVLSEINAFADFYNLIRQPDQGIVQYVSEFDLKYSTCESAGIKLPSSVVAYILLLAAKLDHTQYQLIKGVIDINAEAKKDNLYEIVKEKMLSMLTNSLGEVVGEKEKGVSDESAFAAENEEVFAAWKANKNWRPSYKGKQGGKNNFNNYRNDRDKEYKGKNTNAVDSFGNVLKCRECGAFNHLVKDCPSKQQQKPKTFYKYKQKNGRQVYMCERDSTDEDSTHEGESDHEIYYTAIMYTTDKKELSRFTAEALNCAALDTCCTSTVAGKKWLDIYLDSLPVNMKRLVQGPFKSNKTFMFGNEGKLTASEAYKLPINVAGKTQLISADIIESDIPCLLSKAEMKALGMTLDMKNDTASINGEQIKVSTTSAGHFIMDLIDQDETCNFVQRMNEVLEEAHVVDLMKVDRTQQANLLLKIHKQFGHRPKRVFVSLLKDAGKWAPHFSQMLNDIINKCEGCILRKRNPDRPAVALPRAEDFNEILTMDLKIWDGKYILYLIDMHTRYTVGTVIARKQPNNVIDAIFYHWIKHFGIPGRIMTDNGGEFTGEEMRAVTSYLYVYKETTAAEAPWMNGICEKNHALVDNILQQVMRDYPDLSLNTALAWALSAKNSLSNVYGYSSYQLVFGKNPRLPNVINDPPPAWEILPQSKALVKHLNALHASREAYIKAEKSEKLKTALKTKIRSVDKVYNPGDYAFYKREKDVEYRGPAKVLVQDGKIVWLRHGSYCCKVSVNRLQPVHDDLKQEYRRQESADQRLETEVKQEPALQDSKEEGVTEEASDHRNAKDDNSEDEPDHRLVDDSSDIEDDGAEEPDHIAPESEHRQDEDNDAEESDHTHDNSNEDNNGETNKAPEIMKIKKNERLEVRNDEQTGGRWERATITGRAGKAKTWPDHWNFKCDSGKEFHADIKELDLRPLSEEEALAVYTHEYMLAVMIPKDQQNTDECIAAKNAELKKLTDFDTYEIVEDIGQKHITCTWVMTQKGKEARARLTARGFLEEEEFPTDSPTIQKYTLRTALAIAASKEWEITATDIKSAFLQGSELEREVYVKPPREANNKGKLWRLRKCLYGLKDASKAWYTKVAKKLEKAGFVASYYDPGFFYLKDKSGRLIGMVGLHVDDFISAGTHYFNMHVIPGILSSFQVGKSETRSFLYTGFQIDQTQGGITLDQDDYVSRLVIPSLPAERLLHKENEMTPEELTTYRGMVGATNWVVRTSRPDLSYDMIHLSTKFKGGNIENLKEARKVLTNIVQNKARITLSNIGDLRAAELWLYTDASFGNLNDGVDSTGSYIIMLVNPRDGRCAPLDWKSNKVKRVVTSTLAAETLSLTCGLDAAVALKEQLQDLLGIDHDIKLRALVDNKSAVDAAHTTVTHTTERRLKREIGSVKEMLKNGELKELKWVPTNLMLADALTKKGVNSLKLMEVMQKGKLGSDYVSSVRH